MLGLGEEFKVKPIDLKHACMYDLNLNKKRIMFKNIREPMEIYIISVI